MNHRSKGQLMCRLEGCQHEVLFKTVDSGGGSGGGYIDPLERRASIIRDRNGHTLQGRGSPAGAGAPGGGGDDETYARCPVPECSQARLQYLDPAYESRHGDSLPVYQRWEYCADHGCRADGCKKLVLEKQICCEEPGWMWNDSRGEISLLCHPARHNVAGTKEYLRFCVDHATCAVNRCKDMKVEQSLYCAHHTCRERGCNKSSQSKPFCSEHCCAEVNCRFPRPWAASPNPRDKFCPLHCPEFVDRLAIFCRTHGCSKPKCHQEVIVEGFCLDHLKAHYITQGELKARGGSSSSPKDSPTSTTGQPTTMTTRPNPAQPPTFPRRLSQQSLTSTRPGPGQRANSILLHNGHAHEILIPPDEHPDELLDHSRVDPIRFQLNQVVAQQQQHARQAYQAHVDDPDPDLDNDENDNDDNDDDDDDDDINDHHHLPPNLNPKPGGGSGGSNRSSLSSEAVSALSDNENIGAAAVIVNGSSLVNGTSGVGNGGAESPGDPPEYSKVAAPGSIVSVGQGQGQGHGEGGETKTGGGSRREERERERNRRKVLERDGTGTGTGGGVGMPGSFVGGGDGKGEDSDGW
uniref:Uncharacterized protein B19C19.090 n=1 Tax=Neurospora crassa TaxID=5141 RepID=Q8X064_NEUCS|nr:hypothetical protein [Neurospora crassa]